MVVMFDLGLKFYGISITQSMKWNLISTTDLDYCLCFCVSISVLFHSIARFIWSAMDLNSEYVLCTKAWIPQLHIKSYHFWPFKLLVLGFLILAQRLYLGLHG